MCADTWVTISVFKYTEQEILARGHTAEVIKDQLCGQLKICQDLDMHLTWQHEPGCMHVSVHSNPSPAATPPLLANGFMFAVTGLGLLWLASAAHVNGPCFRMSVIWYGASCPSLVCVGSWMMPCLGFFSVSVLTVSGLVTRDLFNAELNGTSRTCTLQVQVNHPTLPRYTSRNPTQRATLVEKELKSLGVRGQSLFASLSYFKCASTDTCGGSMNVLRLH